MIEFFVKTQPTRRIVCRNEETYIFFWPYLFSREVPGARPLCRWAARRGAAVHGGVRLQPSSNADAPHRCSLSATRAIPAGQALISLPFALALSAPPTEMAKGTFAEPYNVLESLAQVLARELHNPRSPHRPYLEFLYDLHNTDAEEQEEFFAELQYGRAAALTQQLDAMYGGNTLHARGAPNAPFLQKQDLVSAAQRVEWVRFQQMLRRLEQSVPHFAAKSTAWALSMALSRSLEDSAEQRTLFPLIDFCAHSYHPNAQLVMDGSDGAHKLRPVRWSCAADGGPCVHLVASRPVKEGESITLRWSEQRADTPQEKELWRMHYGFVPDKES